MLTWFAALLLLNALITLGLLRLLLDAQVRDEAREQLQLEAQELADLAADDPTVRELLETFLRANVPAEDETFVTLVGGRPFLRSAAEPPVRLDLDEALVAEWAAVEAQVLGSADTEAGRIQWLAVPVVGDERGVMVAASFTDLRAADLRGVVTTAGLLQLGVGALLLLALGRTLTRGLARPLAEMTATTRSIEATDPGRRLEVHGRDELAELATTVNGLLDRLERELGARRDLVADAGHELRTPITIVQGHLDTLPDDPDGRAATIALVQDELTRMAGLVSDLLALATADSDGFVRPAPVDLADLGARLGEVVRPLAARAWEVVADEAPARLDPARIRQAVVALVDNAVRHTEEGDAIRIVLRRREDHVEVAVQDEGVGIPADLLPSVTERFRTGAGPRGGAGIGLALVAAIADGHGGEVRIESTEGSGTTVRLLLPQED